MDRLHAYCYFLEALLAVPDPPEVRQALTAGMARVGMLLKRIGPRFERSDVGAQLLRVRLIAHQQGVAFVDLASVEQAAEHIAGFQAASENPRLDGGFWFGVKEGTILPYSNPVSTAFGMQALALSVEYGNHELNLTLGQLI
jgi:hypothetical protein